MMEMGNGGRADPPSDLGVLSGSRSREPCAARVVVFDLPCRLRMGFGGEILLVPFA